MNGDGLDVLAPHHRPHAYPARHPGVLAVVENTGDVAFNPISLTDDTLDISSCNTAWSATTLPVAVAGNDDHIATCVIGPLTAAAGQHINTAHATGTYDGSPYDSYDATAEYATASLTIVKSVAESFVVACEGGAHK